MLPTYNSIVYTFPLQKGRIGYSEEILNQNKMGSQPGKHQILKLCVWALVSKDLDGSALIFAACTSPSISVLHVCSSPQHVSNL